MALALSAAGQLKPEIRLAQAISEYEAILNDSQKAKFRTYRQNAPPDAADVIRLTAEIDRDGSRRSRQCVGPRLTNVLQTVQQFSTLVDLVIGGSQNLIAAAVWGVLKMSLQLASGFESYFDKMSTLFMNIGRTCPRLQELGLLCPKSSRLQKSICEYLIVVTKLCRKSVLFLHRSFIAQFSSSISSQSEFGIFQSNLEGLAVAIRDEVAFLSIQAQYDEAMENTRVRALAARFSAKASLELQEAISRRRLKARIRFLEACSTYDFQRGWKKARRKGTSGWICERDEYKEWKEHTSSSTLWLTGVLGSGKTVCMANVVEDLISTAATGTVSYFFCMYDAAESLKASTIIGSLARQLFDGLPLDSFDRVADGANKTEIDADRVLSYLQEMLPSKQRRHYFIIDGLDECKESEVRLLLDYMKRLFRSDHQFQMFCSSRQSVLEWGPPLVNTQWRISMSMAASETKSELAEYIERELEQRIESRSFRPSNPMTLFPAIVDALLQGAKGMFLWVIFQLDTICDQDTDAAILKALDDLPRDLSETFDRILRKSCAPEKDRHSIRAQIFEIVTAAQRPLSLDELREAINVKIGETTWDETELINDMSKTIAAFGSLLIIDEEYLTVHFAHHSVKQHIHSKNTDSGANSYYINLREAESRLGEICVTYLNLSIFETRVARTAQPPQKPNYSSDIIRSCLSQNNMAGRLTLKFLKTRGEQGYDITSYLEQMRPSAHHETQKDYAFLSYAQEFWLLHTKSIDSSRGDVYRLWCRLLDGEVTVVSLPWAPETWDQLGDDFINWMVKREHRAVLNLVDGFIRKSSKRKELYTKVSWTMKQGLQERWKEIDFESKYIGLMMYMALGNDDMPLVILLLNNMNGPGIEAGMENYGKAFIAASYYGFTAHIKILLRKGVDVNHPGPDGTALYVASLRGHHRVVQLLLENGADPNPKDPEGTTLKVASANWLGTFVQLPLKNGANVNAQHGQYGTALIAASYSGHKTVVRLLLENGADVNAQHGRYGTALIAASLLSHQDIMRLLLENGAEINAQCGEYGTALIAASYSGHKTVVRLLLENGADVNAQCREHGTALIAALQYGHETVAQLLLENNADVNAQCGEHGTALIAASHRGYKTILRFLIKNGAEVNAQCGQWGTALIVASLFGRQDIVQLLLENGADINPRGQYGTALEVARSAGVRKLLEEAQARAELFETPHAMDSPQP